MLVEQGLKHGPSVKKSRIYRTQGPFLRRPRGDSRRKAEQKREDEARRAAEIAERWAIFIANDNEKGWA